MSIGSDGLCSLLVMHASLVQAPYLIKELGATLERLREIGAFFIAKKVYSPIAQLVERWQVSLIVS